MAVPLAPVDVFVAFRPYATVTLEAGDLDGALIVLDYQNAIIKGHVDVVGDLPASARLTAHISGPAEKRSWSMQHGLDSDGNFSVDAFGPGTYQVFISDRGEKLTEPRTFELKKNQKMVLSLRVDLGAKQERR